MARSYGRNVIGIAVAATRLCLSLTVRQGLQPKYGARPDSEPDDKPSPLGVAVLPTTDGRKRKKAPTLAEGGGFVIVGSMECPNGGSCKDPEWCQQGGPCTVAVPMNDWERREVAPLEVDRALRDYYSGSGTK